MFIVFQQVSIDDPGRGGRREVWIGPQGWQETGQGQGSWFGQRMGCLGAKLSKRCLAGWLAVCAVEGSLRRGREKQELGTRLF